jgi:hypothetical protein
LGLAHNCDGPPPRQTGVGEKLIECSTLKDSWRLGADPQNFIHDSILLFYLQTLPGKKDFIVTLLAGSREPGWAAKIQELSTLEVSRFRDLKLQVVA